MSFGAPFHDLACPSDRIEVENRAGKLFVYRVVESTIVDPDETWVIGPDPLGTNERLLTMTTCHPKLSDRQRLVVWAELDEDRTAASGGVACRPLARVVPRRHGRLERTTLLGLHVLAGL